MTKESDKAVDIELEHLKHEFAELTEKQGSSSYAEAWDCSRSLSKEALKQQIKHLRAR